MLRKPASLSLLSTSLMMTTAMTAFADGHATKTLGETTALIAETGMALTGYPDGQAAWLQDEETVRVAYQSESYATMGRAPNPETYPWVMSNGVSFTGSHIHTIDFERAAFAGFMSNEDAANTMVKGSGKLFSTVYNAFGEMVTAPSFDPTNLASKWGKQTRPDGSLMQFSPDFRLTAADFFFQSFCGAWYEQANKYGEGIGFADDAATLVEEPNPASNMIDEYIQNQDAPGTFAANFVPTSYQWGGGDNPVAVQDTEMMLWESEGERPEGGIYFNGDAGGQILMFTMNPSAM